MFQNKQKKRTIYKNKRTNELNTKWTSKDEGRRRKIELNEENGFKKNGNKLSSQGLNEVQLIKFEILSMWKRKNNRLTDFGFKCQMYNTSPNPDFGIKWLVKQYLLKIIHKDNYLLNLSQEIK